MSILNDGAKTFVSGVAPLIGLTCDTGIFAEECRPTAVYSSGKCATAFACYVYGTTTCGSVQVLGILY